VKLKQTLDGFTERHRIEPEVRFELNLAIEEAVANIIQHGDLPEAGGRIFLALQLEGALIKAELRDNGRPFNPLAADVPDLETPFEDRDIGGLGIFYLRQMTDELTYHYEDGENILAMKKRIS